MKDKDECFNFTVGTPTRSAFQLLSTRQSCWFQIDRSAYFRNCLSMWYFHTQPSLEFAGSGPKKANYPVNSGSRYTNARLMSEENGQTALSYKESNGNWSTRLLVTTKPCRKTHLNAQHVNLWWKFHNRRWTTLPGLVSRMDFCFNIQTVGSEFGTNILNARWHISAIQAAGCGVMAGTISLGSYFTPEYQMNIA